MTDKNSTPKNYSAPIPKKRNCSKKSDCQQAEFKKMKESPQETKKPRKQQKKSPSPVTTVPKNWIEMFDKPITLHEFEDNLARDNPDIKDDRIPLYALRLLDVVKPSEIELNGQTYYYTAPNKQ